MRLALGKLFVKQWILILNVLLGVSFLFSVVYVVSEGRVEFHIRSIWIPITNRLKEPNS